MKNPCFEDNQKQNCLEGGKDANKKFRVAVVVLELQLVDCSNNLSGKPTQGPEGSDYFAVPLKLGQQYVMLGTRHMGNRRGLWRQ